MIDQLLSKKQIEQLNQWKFDRTDSHEQLVNKLMLLILNKEIKKNGIRRIENRSK